MDYSEDEAFEDGKESALAGKGREYCPFSCSTDLYGAWQTGWEEGFKEKD